MFGLQLGWIEEKGIGYRRQGVSSLQDGGVGFLKSLE